jgi:acyl transferase domain-containing protein
VSGSRSSQHQARLDGAHRPEQPRRAAVSSFGFGGTNFHVVVEEYDRNGPGALPEVASVDLWPSEVAYWTSPSVQHLAAALEQLDNRLSVAADVPLRDVAAALCRTAKASAGHPVRLAIVAASINDLRGKMKEVRDAIQQGRARISETRGIYLAESAVRHGKIAFLFPGQGSQYPGMLRDLSIHFPDIRHAMEVADRVTSVSHSRRLITCFHPRRSRRAGATGAT